MKWTVWLEMVAWSALGGAVGYLQAHLPSVPPTTWQAWGSVLVGAGGAALTAVVNRWLPPPGTFVAGKAVIKQEDEK